MKSTERHKLKENELARSVAAARDVLSTRGSDITRLAIAALVVVVIIAGYTMWRQSRNTKAQAALASGLALFEAPVMPIAAPAPGSPLPLQQPGTFPTEQAKYDAALPKLIEAADKYPNTDSGIAARYYAASALASLGRFAEAEQRYQEVAQKAGSSSIYRETARLGIGEAQLAQGKADAAMTTFKEIAADTNSQLPVDGVLMQLGRAALVAGKKDEATRAFTRVTDEFPQSLYVTEAKEKLAGLKKA